MKSVVFCVNPSKQYMLQDIDFIMHSTFNSPTNWQFLFQNSDFPTVRLITVFLFLFIGWICSKLHSAASITVQIGY